MYIGFPWATLIDHLNQGNPKVNGLLAALDAIAAACQGRQQRITVCQQVYLSRHTWILKRAGITDIFWPHTTPENDLAGIRLQPFPLDPVQWQRPGAEDPDRTIVLSFIGARAKPHDLTKNALIIGNDNWFYDDLVYGVQISGSISASDPLGEGHGRPTRSGSGKRSAAERFRWCSPTAGCRQGHGSYGMRPCSFSATRPRACGTSRSAAARWASKPALLERRRAALAKLWQRYRPSTFITMISSATGAGVNAETG